MRSNRRVFYVFYSKDTQDQSVLDAICFLADPSEKNRAHVTVRGPYRQKRGVPAISRAVDGSEIAVTGVDAFLEPGQNTVFFALSAPALDLVWHKPDFPESQPHLTIYDGKSREFAVKLRSRLQQVNPRFRFQATPLAPLVTKKGQGSFELRAAFDEGLVRRVTGAHVTADAVSDLPAEERIDLIAKLCSRLAERGQADHVFDDTGADAYVAG
jgi:hypothetical protein